MRVKERGSTVIAFVSRKLHEAWPEKLSAVTQGVVIGDLVQKSCFLMGSRLLLCGFCHILLVFDERPRSFDLKFK